MKIQKYFIVPLLVFINSFTIAQQQPVNYVRSIGTSSSGGVVSVKIELAQPLRSKPSEFAVLTPPRIVVDLPGVDAANAIGDVNVGRTSLRSISISGHTKNSTRVVLNLTKEQVFNVKVVDNFVLIALDPNGENDIEGFDAPLTPRAVKDIDFKRTSGGGGQIVVSLTNPKTQINLNQIGKGIELSLTDTSLPDILRRRIDVTDFGTPVQMISASNIQGNTQLLVEARGNWEHTAHQIDDQFVLEIRPVTVDPNKLTKGSGYSGEKLSFNFQNIAMRSLLQVIADFTKFNIITSETVAGSLTLRLADVPWDQAFDIILQSKGLAARKTGNVVWVAPREEIVAKERAEFQAQQELDTLTPVRSQNFALNYVKASVLANALVGNQLGNNNQQGRSVLSNRGTIIVEERTNQMFITDIPAKLEEIALLISKVDIPVRQVMIEAKIVEAQENFGRSLGARISHGESNAPASLTSDTNFRVSPSIAGTVTNNNNYIDSLKNPGSPVGVALTPLVNLPAANSLGSIAFSLMSASSTKTLALELSAGETEGQVKTVASPRVVTSDQKAATIRQGVQIPYVTRSGTGDATVTFQNADLNLTVTPQITPEGNIILDVNVNKSTPGQEYEGKASISTKSVTTQVLVENGGTVVIGGIFERVTTDGKSGVPFFSKLPIIGVLFRSTQKSTTRTETLIFLSPKIVSERVVVR